jgi:ATP-dependent Clp protease ATP-binding subunit ClpA
MSNLIGPLDESCLEALDAAKRALPDGQRLDVPALLDALFHATTLKEQPALLPFAGYFPPPHPLREEAAPAKVDEGLKRALLGLVGRGPVRPLQLFVVLLASEPGRRALLQRGLSADELATLAANLAPAPVAPSADELRRARHPKLLHDLGEHGRLLTASDAPARPDPRVRPDRPVRTLLMHLLAPRRRSVLLVGPPGIGKTSLLHALAERLLAHDGLPAPLRDLDLFELSPNFPRTADGRSADFNPALDFQRVRNFLRALEAHPGVVLCVDRFYAFVGLLHRISLHQELFDSFKHSLDTGAITCIGCLQTEELARLAELDPSLARRFRVLHLPPPGGGDLLRILEGRRGKLEQHFHPLQVPAELLPRAVALADEHLRERYQPEKSLRLLESACARAALEAPPAPALTETHLLQAVEDFVGPVVVPGPPLGVEELYERLRQHIIGQEEVLGKLAQAVVAGRADNGWFLRPGPRGVFLFGGPTGVGKTETALQLARLLGGGREALVRVDCQNLQGSGSGWEANTLTWRLLGVAPGYRGHVPGCRDGLLVKVRDFPECVLLFDEFEKADATVGRLMLRILDEGKAQDSEGNELDFRRCFVVLTSNAGVSYADPERGSLVFTRPSPGPAAPLAKTADLERDLLSSGLGQEFLGRVQHVFLFQGLGLDHVKGVLERQLTELQGFAKVRGKLLDWSPAVIDHLAGLWQKQQNLGARYLASLVRNHILDQLNIAASLGELSGEVGRVHIDIVPPDNRAGPAAGRSARKRQGDRLLIELS